MNLVIDEEVKNLGIKVVYLLIDNLDNNNDKPELKNYFKDYYESVVKDYTYQSIIDHEYILGYQTLHKSINVNNTGLIPSPESMFKMLFEKRKLPSINFLVDCYNFISLKSKISIGAHDVDLIDGDVELKMAKGDEKFIPLGKKQPVCVNSGEYCYFDESQEILCRLECKQSNKTKISPHTHSALVIFQGNTNINDDSLFIAAEELSNMLMDNSDSALEFSVTLR